MIPHLVNFGPELWRGGQPEEPADWEHLAGLGVNQVIKLNAHWEGIDQVLGLMKLFYCPLSPVQQVFTEPDLQQIRDAVAFIEPGTFIHCTHGQDRTGLVVGAYRVSRCGWTKEQAYYEMLERGFHPILLGLAKAWEDLNA